MQLKIKKQMKKHYIRMKKIGEMQLNPKLIQQEKFKIDG